MTSSEAAETQFLLTCRNSYCSGAVCPFFRDITYLISFLDGLKVLKRLGRLCRMGLYKDSF